MTLLNSKRSVLILNCLFLSIACQRNSPDSQFDANSQTRIIQEVETAVWAFYQADTAMNAEKVIALMWPECTMLIDGHRINYQDLSQGSRQFMSNLDQFHTEWNDLKIIPVAENAAIASFIFKDSIIDKSGNLTYAKGPNTFLWQKRNGEWRVLYGDADHYKLDLD